MLTLEEIYNKYLTMDRIEDDPIIEKLFNDFSPKSEEFLSAEYINTVINNPLINKQELKKLYKPGIPIIPIDRFDFSIVDYPPVFLTRELEITEDLGKLIFSEVIENNPDTYTYKQKIGEYEWECTIDRSISYYKVIYNYEVRNKYKKYYDDYMRTQKIYIYYLPSFNIFNNKPIVREVYKDQYSREFKDSKGKRITIECNYCVAFSEKMLEEQFNVFKRIGIRNMSKRITKMEDNIKSLEKRIEELNKSKDELLEKFFYEEERLNELFKL
jgi:hypothetical protein|nr:MAG TPA: hypothetical protein [Caudoviricetes sp.]